MCKTLYYEYDSVLLGKKPSFSTYFFSKATEEQNEKIALDIIRYAIENYLHWTPTEVYQYFDETVVRMMHLETVIRYVCFPPEADEKKDYFIIAGKLYPDVIKIDIKSLTLMVYKKLLAGKLYKFPKGFFEGAMGSVRARICLRYILSQRYHFESPNEMYKQFASAKGTKILKDSKLLAARLSLYDSAIDYLHDALTDNDKDEYLYHYHKFMAYNERQKKKMMEDGTFLA